MRTLLTDPPYDHHKGLTCASKTKLRNTRYLVLVGGVEGDLAELGVLLPHALHGATAQLDTLQQGGLGGISGHVSLWANTGHTHSE